MSDHLIAEANRHAMTLPTTHPTHADIAWYVREVDQLSAEVKSLREWQQEVIQNAWAHKATVETAIARAERAEAELATERARLDWLQAQEVKRGLEITEGRDDPLPFLVLGEDGTTHWGKTYRAAIDAAMKEGA